MNIGRYLPAFLKLIHQHDLPASLVELGWWNFQSQETPGEPPLWPSDLGGPDLQVKQLVKHQVNFLFLWIYFPENKHHWLESHHFEKEFTSTHFGLVFFQPEKMWVFRGVSIPSGEFLVFETWAFPSLSFETSKKIYRSAPAKPCHVLALHSFQRWGNWELKSSLTTFLRDDEFLAFVNRDHLKYPYSGSIKQAANFSDFRFNSAFFGFVT